MNNNHDQDLDLEEYLKGDSDLSRQYRAESNETTPDFLKHKTRAAIEKLIDADHGTPTAGRRKNWYVPVSLAALLVLTVSLLIMIPDDITDLEEYTREVLNRRGGGVEPVPSLEDREGYSYQSRRYAERDPFQPLDQQPGPEADIEENTYAGLSADMERELANRDQEELERFELDSLRMTGTIEDSDQRWAIILDPDGVSHRVTVGNYIGRNAGRITNVFADRIEIEEAVKNSQGRYEIQQRILPLVSEMD